MAHSIPFKDITIAANRQRQEFDPEAIVDLANSIQKNGLLHAVVVRETDEGYRLVAGERRLRALDSLWIMGEGIRYNNEQYDPYYVPCVTLGELTPLEAEEAELDENLKRRDLTWQERAEALGRLHALRTQQAIEAGESQTIADTLQELATENRPMQGRTYTEDRQALLLAAHLENPVVANAKSVGDAFKALKREEERKKSIALAEKVGENFNSSSHTLINADCRDWLRECPDNTFDVILTDPPYGVGADEFGDGAGRLGNAVHRYKDDMHSFSSLMQEFCPEIYRVTKEQAHAYIFCDLDQFHYLKSLMEKAGWDVFRTPLVVYKLGSGRVPRPEHGPRRQYELCLYGIKGARTVTAIFPDVIPCKLEENIGHGANKPVELFVDLLRRSVRPGDRVLDCFAGTGTIFPAAHECKVYATGIELSPEYYGIAVKRLNALDDEPAMI